MTTSLTSAPHYLLVRDYTTICTKLQQLIQCTDTKHRLCTTDGPTFKRVLQLQQVVVFI